MRVRVCGITLCAHNLLGVKGSTLPSQELAEVSLGRLRREA